MSDEFNEDDTSQPLSPLYVPRIDMTIEWLESIPGVERLWREVREWVNLHQPNVLWRQDMLKRECYLYFGTRELYIEFVQKFPIFLRGSDE